MEFKRIELNCFFDIAEKHTSFEDIFNITEDSNGIEVYFYLPIFRGVDKRYIKEGIVHTHWTNSLKRAIGYALLEDNPYLLVSKIRVPHNKLTLKYIKQAKGNGDSFMDVRINITSPFVDVIKLDYINETMLT